VIVRVGVWGVCFLRFASTPFLVLLCSARPGVRKANAPQYLPRGDLSDSDGSTSVIAILRQQSGVTLASRHIRADGMMVWNVGKMTPVELRQRS
jgi:hypothetical protein